VKCSSPPFSPVSFNADPPSQPSHTSIILLALPSTGPQRPVSSISGPPTDSWLTCDTCDSFLAKLSGNSRPPSPHRRRLEARCAFQSPPVLDEDRCLPCSILPTRVQSSPLTHSNADSKGRCFLSRPLRCPPHPPLRIPTPFLFYVESRRGHQCRSPGLSFFMNSPYSPKRHSPQRAVISDVQSLSSGLSCQAIHFRPVINSLALSLLDETLVCYPSTLLSIPPDLDFFDFHPRLP